MRMVQATAADAAYLCERDRHMAPTLLDRKVANGEIWMIHDETGSRIGWLRYGFFWDNTPFLNMLWIDEPYRRHGYGRICMTQWERHMADQQYAMVMTSTLANEQAQHFYRALGYTDCGSLLLPGEPLEILFRKPLRADECSV